MASSYDQYKTTGEYDFSKGPKSLYQPDPNAPIDSIFSGVVLNVPQTDTDDEWGGTSRIAEERIIDKLGALELEVEGLAGVGGLKNQMLDLVGTTVKITSFTDPFIDMSVPKISLGIVTATPTVVLNGATGAITAASLTLTGAITAVSADLSGNMSVSGDSTVSGTLNVNIGTFDALTVASLTVSGSASFSHSLSAASIAISGAITAASLTLTGAITAASLTLTGAISAASADLSGNMSVSGDSTVSGILNVNEGTFGALTVASLTVSGSASFSHSLSAASIAVSGAITAASLTISSKITLSTPYMVPVCMLEPTSSYVNLGSSTNYFGGIYTSAFTSYASMFTAYGLFPIDTNTADLGSSAKAFKDIYAVGAISAASADLSGNMSVSGDSTVSGILNVNEGTFGALTVASLTVSGSASFSHSLYASGTLYVPTVSASSLSLTGTVNVAVGVPNHLMFYSVSGIIAQSTVKFDVDSPTVVFNAPTFKLSMSLPTATHTGSIKYLYVDTSDGKVYVETP